MIGRFLAIWIATMSYIAVAHSQQGTGLWHGQQRVIHYQPEGKDFVTTTGTRRFNRALYGTNTAFRIEAGDWPEFALYLPGMGGNLKFGLVAGDSSKWLTGTASIKAIYRPGSMRYEIKDPWLGTGIFYITVLALADAEGMIVQTKYTGPVKKIALVWVFGGATGKKFSRDGDLGADPESSFYLQPEYCKDNVYRIQGNGFSLAYGSGRVLTEEERYEINHTGEKKDSASGNPKNSKLLSGVFPPGELHLADAGQQDSPLQLFRSNASSAPVITGKKNLDTTGSYFLILNSGQAVDLTYSLLPALFMEAEQARKKKAAQISIQTPDPFLNTIDGALSIAADAIWEAPSYLHGAVAWRMRLNGWRGAYAGDVMGWHDRARQHFNSYAASQLTAPPVTGVVMDTALHLARHLEKIGTALFSDGYISRNPYDSSRAHHYDMNLVFIDQLLNHFNWTGDTAYVRLLWPLIERHLAWEKRNFDADDDGLYDAYAAIWASDALQYSGGGVTHTSAYNYRANLSAAILARLIGRDPSRYENEARKIREAVDKNLWLPGQGWYAEYKDKTGLQRVHPSAGLWTIYHALDAKLADPFQAWQSLEYINNNIPHIPVRAKGLQQKDLYLLSATNWQPYTWSLNNVVLAENLHTALAYWQGNRPEEAFRLWKSTLVESMYLGASPGNIGQLLFYDAMRGELYRDFADGVGMAARSLAEGLFGIEPDALHDTLAIHPGFPSQWKYAGLQTPDIHFDFKRTGNRDTYIIQPFFSRQLHLKFIVPVYKDAIGEIRVNNKPALWKLIGTAVGMPFLALDIEAADHYSIEINWKGVPVESAVPLYKVTYNQSFMISFPGKKLIRVFDPQGIWVNPVISNNSLKAIPTDRLGNKTVFVKLKQGMVEWWQPVRVWVMPDLSGIKVSAINANLSYPLHFEKIDLQNYFNDKVTSIFKHQYLSPRPVSPTLQLPIQGIGNWAYPLIMANIDDSGVRKRAGAGNEIRSADEIPFATPSDSLLDNIIFTSQWDNFPDSVVIPLSGKASSISLLMAGSTNAMQSRITNGIVTVRYTDGTADTLLLKNPENWWPIEQDYYTDGFAFTAGDEMPERLYLKQGKFARGLPAYTSIKGFSNRVIDGGAATVLDMYTDENKTLQSLTVHAVANDVVIGLMAITLLRPK